MRDFLLILQTHKYFKDERWNRSDFRYTFETGSIIEFFSADQPSKVRGPRRDRLYINEANNITYEAFDQLEVRTKEFIFLDWNPVSSYWYYDQVANRNDVEHIILTYRDNEGLDENIIRSIEQRKGNARWWKVYGEGQLGEADGRIYTGWEIIESIPPEARLERRGLDFGYTNDETAIVDLYRWNGAFILDEHTYLKGLSNKNIADRILNSPQPLTLVVADSAEPKSIDELKLYGVNIIGADKSKGSVNQGIQYIQDQKIFMTKRSVHLIKEYRNYLWMKDRDGKILNTPEGGLDHCFAEGSLVHTVSGLVPIESLIGKEGYLFSINGEVQRFHSARKTRTDVEVCQLFFKDGGSISVTEDHLLLQPNGVWKEAALFVTGDLIQSVTYAPHSIRHQAVILWEGLCKVFRRKLLQSENRAQHGIPPQVCMGASERADSERLPYSPQEPRQGLQRTTQPRNETSGGASTGAYDARASRESARACGKDTASCDEVALVRRGKGVAQATWQRNIPKKKTFSEKVRALPYSIYNITVSKIRQILRAELQDESETKEIVRIARRREKNTFNLEVEGTEALLVDGVIAHNCLDSLRYAFSSLRPVVHRTEDTYIEPKHESLYDDIGV